MLPVFPRSTSGKLHRSLESPVLSAADGPPARETTSVPSAVHNPNAPEKAEDGVMGMPAISSSSSSRCVAGGGSVAAKANREVRQGQTVGESLPSSREASHSLVSEAQGSHGLPTAPAAGPDSPLPPVMPTDTDSVHLLQRMQQLLQDGVSPVVLQQWVSNQLLAQQQPQPQRRGTPTLAAKPLDSALSFYSSPLSTGSGSGTGIVGIPPGSTHRRPASAVSFTVVPPDPLTAQSSPDFSPLKGGTSTVTTGGIGGSNNPRNNAAANVAVPAGGPRDAFRARDGPTAGFTPATPSVPPQPLASIAMARTAHNHIPAMSACVATENAAATGAAPPPTAETARGSVTTVVSVRQGGAWDEDGSSSGETPGYLLRRSKPPPPDLFHAHPPVAGSLSPVAKDGTTGGEKDGVVANHPTTTGSLGQRHSFSISSWSPTNVAPVEFGVATSAAAAAAGGGANNISTCGLPRAARSHTYTQTQTQSPQLQRRPLPHGSFTTVNVNDTAGVNASILDVAGSPLPASYVSHISAAASPTKSFSKNNSSSSGLDGPATPRQLRGSAARRAHETSMHEITMAAIQASTSRLMADEQRNLGLLLGERFSRHPESSARRLATPLSSRFVTPAFAGGAAAAAAGSASPEGTRVGAPTVVDSCLPSIVGDRHDFVPSNSQSRSTTPPAMGVLPLPLVHDAVALVPSVLSTNTAFDADYGESSAEDAAATTAPVRTSRGSILFAFDVQENGGGDVEVEVASRNPAAASSAVHGVAAASSHESGADSKAKRYLAEAVAPLSFSPVKSPQNSVHTSRSAPNTTGVLSCESDALLPSPSLLVSPAVSSTGSMVANLKRGGRQYAERRSPSVPLAASPITNGAVAAGVVAAAAAQCGSGTTAMSSPHKKGPTSVTAKRHSPANLITVMEVGDSEGEGAPPLPLIDFFNSSAVRPGSVVVTAPPTQPSNGPRAWGGGNNVGEGCVQEGTPVGAFASSNATTATAAAGLNTSVASFAWLQSPRTAAGGGGGANASVTSSVMGGVGNASHGQHRHRGTHAHSCRSSFISNASSHLGNASLPCGGGGAGRVRVYSAGDDVSSFNSSNDVSGVEWDDHGISSATVIGTFGGGDGYISNKLRRSSVLHLSHASVNGGQDPTLEGMMTDFVLDDRTGGQMRSGPRFVRTYCRHSPVFLKESRTRSLLTELEVPFLENIDAASVPTHLMYLMASYGFTDSRAFYVVVCLNVLLRYHLVERFAWDVKKLHAFLQAASTFFREGSAMHHPLHAADVVLAAHQWLREGTTAVSLSDDEIAAFLLAAVSVQLAHTGADNCLLTELKHPYAMLCGYMSPQQGAIVALVLALLQQPALRFFPESRPVSAAAGEQTAPTVPTDVTAAAMQAQPAHEWTKRQESRLYDAFAELVMATDVRNHGALQQAIIQMGEENARRHGCFCSESERLAAAAVTEASAYQNLYGTAPLAAAYKPQKSTAARAHAAAADGSPSSGARREPESYCLTCCAYITETHTLDVLKAVLHFIDFTYLFRPYEIYLAGSLLQVAEMYQQSKVGMWLRPRRQAKAAAGAGAAVGPHATTAALRSILVVNPAKSEGDNTETTTVAAALLPFSAETSEKPLAHVTLPAAVDVSAPLSQCTTVTYPEPPPASRASAPSADPSASPSEARPAGNRAPLSPPPPLLGHGRDLFLISAEDNCLPFLVHLAPYLPESWVAAVYANYQTFLASMPSSEAFDAVVERLLHLGQESEEDILRKAKEEEEQYEGGNVAARGLAANMPWLQLHQLCQIDPVWSVNDDGLVRRVLHVLMENAERALADGIA